MKLSIRFNTLESLDQITECLASLDLNASLLCTEVVCVHVQNVCILFCKGISSHPDLQAAEVSGMLPLHVKSHSWSLSRFFKRQHTDLADTILVVPDIYETVFSYSLHIFFGTDDFL